MIKALAALLPLGAMGASAALAATPAKPVDGAATQRGVAERLQAIRGAVSQLTDEAARLEPGDPNVQKVQWLNWGAPGWRNGGWNNWRNGWHNGGWNNWNNGWQNGGWHNWHNGWRNW
jgi:rSAM-associated Gly-rich repeat protein